jgi:hypothetical protein
MSAAVFVETLRKRLVQAVEAEEATINAGALDFEGYKMRTGLRRGLVMAQDLVEQVLRDYQKN